jgi:hypothetical protein
MTDSTTTDDPAGAAYAELLASAARAAELVRDPARGVSSDDDRAAGYLYATELVRQSLDLYVDGDGDEPRFVPFSSPVSYHAGPIAVHRIQGGVNPDGLYDFAVLRPDRSYRVRGRRGNDTYLSLSFSGGKPGARPDRTAATFNDRQIDFAPDGTFEVIVSAEHHDGNWVEMADDICSLIVRQYFLVPPAERVPATLSIEVMDEVEPVSPAAATVARLRAAAAFVDSTLQMYPFPEAPANRFGEPLGYTGSAGALGTTDNCYAMGRWQLRPGESLVVATTPIDCVYWSLQLWNRWGQSLTPSIDDSQYPRQIVNSANASREADGSVRIVVSDTDPGGGNWLDTFGWDHGVAIFRYLYPEAQPLRPETHLEPDPR